MNSLERKTRSKFSLNYNVLILLLLLATAIIAAAAFGAVSIPPLRIVEIISHKLYPGAAPGHWPPSHEQILFSIRFPRIALAVLVGLSLGLAGTTLQGVLQNPLADPYLIGLSSGAALGASIGIIIRKSLGAFGSSMVPLFAFFGGMVSLLIVLSLARRGTKIPVTHLILAGVATSALFSALVSLLIVLHGDRMEEIIFWMMGGLTNATWNSALILTGYLIPGSIIILLYSRSLNIMMFGETSAHYLGLDVESVKKLLLVAATFITAAAVSMTGLIGFVGLIVPHSLRRIVGSDHRILLPASALGGALLMVIADTIARTALLPREIPVGVVTALTGAPFFLYLLKKSVR